MAYRWRRVAALLAACSVLLLTVGCSKGMSEMDISEIASLIESDLNFPTLVLVNDEGLSNYFDLSPSMLVDYQAKLSASEEHADEYGVFQVASLDHVPDVSAAILDHLMVRANIFKQTSDIEYNKLHNAVVRQAGHIVVYVVCEDYMMAAELLDNHGARMIK